MVDNSHIENIAPPTQENFSHEDIFLFERKHKQKQTEKRQKMQTYLHYGLVLLYTVKRNNFVDKRVPTKTEPQCVQSELLSSADN